jgi:thiamine biosynthesis lipoprotein
MLKPMSKEESDPVRTTTHSFRSMGTQVTLIAPSDSAPAAFRRAVSGVERIFAREDARFSRFRPESELSRVNARAGTWVQVSEPFATLMERALRAAGETGGLFDPTVLRALKAAGYDRDFAEVRDRGDLEDTDLREIRRRFRELMIECSTACGAWRDLELHDDRIRVPEGAELDFGGIAKGWTVDLAAQSLKDLRWAIVDAGGDLRIVGETPPEGLDVAIEDPHAFGIEALRLRVGSGAIATSSVTARSWAAGAHHLIDPRTSLPALTGVVQATVWGPTCTDAEVWSKAALLSGPSILERVPASLVLETGEIVTNFVEGRASASSEEALAEAARC